MSLPRVALAVVLVLIMATVASAQFALPRPQFFVNAKPTWQHYKADLHEGQRTLTLRKLQWELSGQVVWPGAGLLRYTCNPSISSEETFTPESYLNVGGVEWKTEDNAEVKPVTLDFSARSRRLTADVFMPNSPLRFTGQLEQARFVIDARSAELSGSEVFERTFWGIGLVFDRSPVLVRVVAGDNYAFVEAGLYQQLTRWCQAGAYYQHKEFRFVGMTVRSDGFGVWLEVR